VLKRAIMLFLSCERHAYGFWWMQWSAWSRASRIAEHTPLTTDAKHSRTPFHSHSSLIRLVVTQTNDSHNIPSVSLLLLEVLHYGIACIWARKTDQTFVTEGSRKDLIVDAAKRSMWVSRCIVR
jgi:hypothetical protein